MKNLKYFPYERNRYFYGKLLSVDDFETEQKYMNDKRRLINRFMHGCGVVCGLDVVAVGDDSISLESGMALDFCGREIIVDTPVTKRLMDIEGFPDEDSEDENNSYLYLCIEYEEHEKDPVYSIAGGNTTGDEVCYNRTKEGYRIYFTSQEPESNTGGSDAYYEEWKTVYWGNGIRISQVFPKFVKSGSTFDFRLVVENMGQKLPVSFGYELLLDCLKKEGRRRAVLKFEEDGRKRARRYEIPVSLQASFVDKTKGSAELIPGTFWLKVGEHSLDVSAAVKSETEITEEEVLSVITKRYFGEAMKEIKKETYHQSIYLAKIGLIRAGSTVVTDGVEQMPFGQYICSDVLSGVRDRVSGEEQKYQMRQLLAQTQREKQESGTVRDAAQGLLFAEGDVTLWLGIGGMAGKKYFSEPVVHGLGLCNVAVVLGRANESGEASFTYYGAADIFSEDESPVTGELAVKTDAMRGTFVVGLKLTEPTTAEKVTVHWMAFCSGQEKSEVKKGRELFLKPDMVYLSLHEDYYFEPVFEGMTDKELEWSVAEADGGMIDENGMYTAPDIPGIYEIKAKSTAYPEIEASAFAVVRDIVKE